MYEVVLVILNSIPENLLPLISFQLHSSNLALESSHFSFPDLPIYLSHKESFPLSSKWLRLHPSSKKPKLPSSDPANFRPISNLNNISKILEILFLSRLLPHINSSSNFNSFQSAYRPHHSTETALTLTLDNVFHAADNGSATSWYLLT